MADEERKVLLIIADISGYTRFMTANAKALVHAQLVITDLLETILADFDYPIEVSKLEGDAVFLYCKIDTDDWADPEIHDRLCKQLIRSYSNFADRVVQLSQSRLCVCSSCSNIERLRLKIVMHVGTALFHQVGTFNELAGIDVILVHRLLKNSIDADEYVLATDPAFEALRFPKHISWARGSERYDQLGEVSTWTYVPERERQARLTRLHQRSLPKKTLSSNGIYVRRVLETQPIIWGVRKPAPFRHVPQVAGPVSRFFQGLLLLVTTPVVLVLGFVAITVREVYRHFTGVS